MCSSFPDLSLHLSGLFDCYQSFSGPRYRALYQEQVLVSIHSYDFQILNGDLHAAHVARHPLALEHAARRGAGAVGTLMAMEFGTVSHGTSVLSESLDGALESFSFADCRSVDFVACREDISLDFLSQRILGCVFESEFSHISLAGDSGLVEVSLHRFIHTMSVNDFFLACLVSVDDPFLLIHKTDLHRFVPVVFHGLDLSHHAGTGLKDGYRNEYAVVVEDLSHSDFGS